MDYEAELDAALSRVVDLEDELEQKDDAIGALLRAKADAEAETGALRRRNAELEAMARSAS